jgi:Zn-dependent alcohol dehydrogenase
MTDVPQARRRAAAEAGNAVAVLGTGIMGSAMTRNLSATGLRMTV